MAGACFCAISYLVLVYVLGTMAGMEPDTGLRGERHFVNIWGLLFLLVVMILCGVFVPFGLVPF